MPWQAPGARVVAVGGPPGDRVGGSVSVGSLVPLNFSLCAARSLVCVTTSAQPHMLRSTARQQLSYDAGTASSSGPPEPAGRGDSPSTGTATKRRSRVARDSEPVAFGGTTGMREKENACEGADAPVLTTCGFGADLSALPDELLVHVLASLSGLRLRAVLTSWVNDPTSPGAHPSGHCDLFGRTIGHALAAAGACCKAFVFHVHEAATIIADRHRWRLPLVGSAPKHLSKLEQDTKRVQFPIRDGSVWRWMGTQLGEFLHLWTTEVSPGFIGPSSSTLKFAGTATWSSASSSYDLVCALTPITPITILGWPGYSGPSSY